MAEETAIAASDPRAQLAQWANTHDEWIRFLVGEVIATGRPVGEDVVNLAYQLFREEKALEPRTFPTVDELQTETRDDETAPPLTVTRLSEVQGVNALVHGAVIEPDAGLTILYGENGTGKTGYARIFKALADSRTADEILGNIEAEAQDAQFAKVEFNIGDEPAVLEWRGERAVAPFTRMSIFDSPCVTTHVDEDLDYVYVPAALALFNHVSSAIQAVSAKIDGAVRELESGASTIVSRLSRDASVYPLIETLGASTDLEALKREASTDPKVDEKLDSLTQAVASLKANTIGAQLTTRRREERVLEEAGDMASGLLALDADAYNTTLETRAKLEKDYAVFREELFAAADLPAEPDETWSAFVEAGEDYRKHLEAVSAHDASRCLYCRQALSEPARDLVVRYAAYLEDKISADIKGAETTLASSRRAVENLSDNDIAIFIRDFASRDDKPAFFQAVEAVQRLRTEVADAMLAGGSVDADIAALTPAHKALIDSARGEATTDIANLEKQAANREKALSEKQTELVELTAAAELGRSWTAIETHVKNAKEADRLRILKRGLSPLARSLTELSKTVSDQLINQNFDVLFAEECEALRAPQLKVQFVGREGRAQRRKVLSGRHKPSKVLSEGQQKVLAIADFLAEARLAGITAPVIFDDPVSSLDHRRINEVAERIVKLSEVTQVIVFTHDIFFATTLLAMTEKSKRCAYFQVTDDGGIGKVARATGPRWDTLAGIKGKINSTIQAAKQQDGEARAALVRTGYDWVRSWCEVFTETEILRGVTQRYQPNVGMTRLPQINTEKLGEIIPHVVAIFEEACRYIDGHSQPLPTLSVTPTLSGLEAHWDELQGLKKTNDDQ